MADRKIGTIVDKNGEVWTGKIIKTVKDETKLSDWIVPVVGLASAMTSTGEIIRQTVEVNGQQHTGKPVK